MDIPVVGKTIFRRFDQSEMEETGLCVWLRTRKANGRLIWTALVAQPGGVDYVSSENDFRSMHMWHPTDFTVDFDRKRVFPPAAEEVPAEVAEEVLAPAVGRRSKAA